MLHNVNCVQDRRQQLVIFIPRPLDYRKVINPVCAGVEAACKKALKIAADKVKAAQAVRNKLKAELVTSAKELKKHMEKFSVVCKEGQV